MINESKLGGKWPQDKFKQINIAHIHYCTIQGNHD